MYHEAIDSCVDEGILTGSVDFLNRHKDDETPFFLWVSLLNPHPTYMAFEKYQNMYDPDRMPPQRTLEWLKNKPEFYELTRKYRHLDEEPEKLFRKIYAVYLGMITYVDDMVGTIVDTLKKNGQYDDTTVILCSDHGDFAGDAGLVEKWPSAVDDMLARVPLIIRVPGMQGGSRVRELTQSIDIFPTMFDLAGISAHHDQFGVSLRPQLEGAAGDPERAVYCEGGYDAWEPHCFEGYPRAVGHDPLVENEYRPKALQQQERPESVCRVAMQRYRNWKLNIRSDGENELYDLAADPLEYDNLYGRADYQTVRNELILKMLTWFVNTSDVTPWNDYRKAVTK